MKPITFPQQWIHDLRQLWTAWVWARRENHEGRSVANLPALQAGSHFLLRFAVHPTVDARKQGSQLDDSMGIYSAVFLNHKQEKINKTKNAAPLSLRLNHHQQKPTWEWRIWICCCCCWWWCCCCWEGCCCCCCCCWSGGECRESPPPVDSPGAADEPALFRSAFIIHSQIVYSTWKLSFWKHCF